MSPIKLFPGSMCVLAFCSAFCGLLAGCGGGGGSVNGVTSAAYPTVVSGIGSKGPLNGSTVCAYAIVGGVKGAGLGCAANTFNGNYYINLGIYTGPVLFEATGGSYINEATSLSVALTSTLHGLLANAPANMTGGAIPVAVTALTELAYQGANASPGALTVANIHAAVANVQNNFGVADIVSTMPVDALNVAAAATMTQRSYALALATVSQYQQGLPAGTSLAASLQTMQTCLASPATACGTGAASVGAALDKAMNTFQAGHAALAGLTMPVANFGSMSAAASPVLSVNPASLTFVPQTLGVSSPVQTVTLKNTGTATLNNLAAAISLPSDFSLVTPSNCGASLAVAASCTFGVVYTPTANVVSSGVLNIASNAANGTNLQVALNESVTTLTIGHNAGPNSTQTFNPAAVALVTATPVVTHSNTWSGIGAATGSSLNISHTPLSPAGAGTEDLLVMTFTDATKVPALTYVGSCIVSGTSTGVPARLPCAGEGITLNRTTGTLTLLNATFWPTLPSVDVSGTLSFTPY